MRPRALWLLPPPPPLLLLLLLMGPARPERPERTGAPRRPGPALLGAAPDRPSLSRPPAGSQAEICLLPPDRGPCEAPTTRYYYDRHTQTCRPLGRGGCGDSANSFASREACDDACWSIEGKSTWVRAPAVRLPRSWGELC